MPSTSRANGIAATPAAARAVPQEWQFVNVKGPKRNHDKELISIVRAHAMRDVRRKQRLEHTAQHRKRPKARAKESGHAAPSVAAERPVSKKPNDWSFGDKADTESPMAVSEMLPALRITEFGDPPCRDEAELKAECGEDAQPRDHWQRYGEDGTRATKPFMLEKCRTVSPTSVVGDGAFDPFNAMPIAGCARYTSHVLNHFVSVMALNCLPVDLGSGENPLTKTWLPYALQDSTLFLATVTFAVTHLEILSGNYKSPRTLLHKGKLIKALNAKLGDRKYALSNETIGAVAMLAAMESFLGNCKELRVHMNGLQRMVYMRGGLHSLGWDGVLRMFISWQDLLSSEMIPSSLRFKQTPCCLLIRDNQPYSNSIFPELGLSTELCGEIAASLENMRYLSQITTKRNKSQTTMEIMSFDKMRTEIVLRLMSFANQKPVSEMTILDYHIETCRLAALMYIKVALHMYFPLCAVVRRLKAQLMKLIEQGEANRTIGLGAQPGSITWALFVGGVLSLSKKEEEWFALRLARGIRASGVETWAEMEERLGQICWLDKLNTPTCLRLWSRIEAIHAEY